VPSKRKRRRRKEEKKEGIIIIKNTDLKSTSLSKRLQSSMHSEKPEDLKFDTAVRTFNVLEARC